jgi:hypothetical protein
MLGKKSLIAACIVAAAFLLGVLAVLVNEDCCEKDDPERTALMSAAFNGDVKAIRVLYDEAKSSGVRPMEEHWAMEGALRGDHALQLAYRELFSQMEANRRAAVLQGIANRRATPGADCLYKALAASGAEAFSCQEK